MAKKTMDVAREVIAGDWGSGDKRKEALTKAGYNYDEVQKEVNRLLSCRELIIQNMRAWATKVSAENYRYVKWDEPYGHECAKCHPHDGKNRGWQCIGWAVACWHHGGLPSKCDCGVLDNGTSEKIFKASTDEEALRIARKALGINDIKVIRNGGKLIPTSWVQAGDIGSLFNGNTYQHTLMFMGNMKLTDSTSGTKSVADNIMADRNFSAYYQNRLKMLIRYTGNGIVKPAKKTVDELAHEVIDGKWGSGDSRKRALTECGYDYDAVQKRVNEILNPPKPTPSKGSYTGKFPNYRLVKTNAQVIADTIKWAKWIAGNNDFHYGYGTHAHHNGCYFCGTQRMKMGHGIKMPEYTYCCNPFVGAAWAHGGGDATAYKLCHNTNSWDFSKGSGYDASKLFDKLGHPAKSTLKAGDVLCNYTHVALYIGGGQLVEASGGDDNVIHSKNWNNSIHVGALSDSRYKGFERVYRYNGKVDCDRPLYYGEVSDRVADLQNYLNWYTDGEFFKKCGGADGIYGNNTLNHVKQFQEKEIGKGQGDGWVGPKTINAMKAVKK